MCRAFSAAVAAAALLGGGHALAQTRSIHLTDTLRPNPLSFRGTLQDPVALRASGLPLNAADEACGTLGWVEVARAPQVVLRLDKPKRVTIASVEEVMQNAGAYLVHDGDGAYYCLDTVGQAAALDLTPGVWRVYYGPRNHSGEYSFTVKDDTRPAAVAEPPPSTPTFSIEERFVPNPAVLRPALARPAKLRKAIAFGVRCGEETMIGEQPAFTVELHDDHQQAPLRVRTNFKMVVFNAAAGDWSCVDDGDQLRLGVGRHVVHIVWADRNNRYAYDRPWLALEDSGRPRQYLVRPEGDAVHAVPEHIPQPLTITGSSSAARTIDPLATNDCRSVPARPDFYLRTAARVEGASLRPFGDVGHILLVGPLADDGSVRAGTGGDDDGAPAIVHKKLAPNRFCLRRGHAQQLDLDGLYAAYVVGADQATIGYTLRIITRETAIDRLARAADPPDDLPLDRRVVLNWYPDFPDYTFSAAWYAATNQLWLGAPKPLVLFARKDAGRVRAGMPLLVLGYNVVRTEDDPWVILPDGDRAQYARKDLAMAPAGPFVLPAPEAPPLDEVTVVAFLESKDADAFRAKHEALNQCMRKVLAQLDPSGSAGRYDVVTYVGGRVSRIEGLADRFERQARARCNADAFDRYASGVERKAAAAQQRRQAQALKQIAARLRGLFP